ncbi:MAG: T9SS type A sorting domain-containing protein [Bacteroidetes bacterium]|nr:T9SS type A sorting domain-containing protein [Bacteroidota bacterium]
MKRSFTGLLVLFLVLQFGLHGQAPLDFSTRSAADKALYPFVHGVASGDPLHDRVIIWTRLTLPDSGHVPVNWRVATDTGFTDIVRSGTAMAYTWRDRTVKVDVDGLQENRWYYYEFEYQGRRSLIGRTRTAPLGPTDSLRIAVLSCTCYQCGFFNPYASIAERNDLDLVVHVGDYFYEYPSGGYGFNPLLNRLDEPAGELITLGDYRIRHSWYKLEPDSRRIHQNYPFIIIYDDHEFANDAWKGGAQEHNEATEGPWSARLRAGYRAWMEWMPVREPEVTDDYLAYRTLKYGDLVDFIVVDTRTERDQQDLSRIDDETRTMLGPVQYAWLVAQLTQSTAQWKTLVNQVMMAPLEVFGGNVWSFEQWDGYRAERTRLLDTVVNGNVQNFVVLTGDIHSAWVADIRHSSGSAGVEYVVTSSTALNRGISSWLPGTLYLLNPHIKYAELAKRGYMIIDFNQQRTQCDQIFVPSVEYQTTATTVGASWQVLSGTRHAIPAAGPSTRLNPGPIQPPPYPVNSCLIPQNPRTRSVGYTSANVEWDASLDVELYRLEGRLAGTEEPLFTRYVRNSWRYLGSLQENVSYEWRVKTLCKSGAQSPSTEWLSFTTGSSDAGDMDADSVLRSEAPLVLSVQPSPFQTVLGIHFQIEAASSVRFELINMQGASVLTEVLDLVPAGLHFHELYAQDFLEAGVYILRISNGEQYVETRVVKV